LFYPQGGGRRFLRNVGDILTLHDVTKSVRQQVAAKDVARRGSVLLEGRQRMRAEILKGDVREDIRP